MADLAIVGASIRTLDPARPHASAVAARDGIVVAVGDDAEIHRHVGPGTELVDGSGIALVPGLVDSHIHPFGGTDGTRGVELTGLRTLHEVRGALAAERARCAPGEWVLGWGLSYDAFDGEPIGADAVAEAIGEAPSTARARSPPARRSCVTTTGFRPASCARRRRWSSCASECRSAPAHSGSTRTPPRCGA